MTLTGKGVLRPRDNLELGVVGRFSNSNSKFDDFDYVAGTALDAPLSTRTRQLAVRGFDEGAEPVMRQMRDGSYRVVFCTMPPRSHALGAAFDVDGFGDALLNAVKAEVVWDDQDVIHVPAATEEEIREIYQFIVQYGKGM